WQALQKVVFLPSPPDGLAEKAKTFLQRASELMRGGKYHPLQIAAFLHYGLTELHLFQDANGRLARLVTNIYLMQNGFDPFYVVRDAKYTDLYQQEPYDVHFSQYLMQNNLQIKRICEQPPMDDGGVQCVQM